jgi:CpXC protein
MSRMIQRSITCYCENIITIEVPDSVDLDQNPETADEIIEGDYLKTSCDRCGKELKPEFELRFVSSSEGIDLLFLPELLRESFYKGEADTKEAAELVIGYRELREYFLARRLGLMRFPLEAVKLHLLKRAPAGRNIEIYLAAADQTELSFHILGLKEDEVGLVKVPRTSYEGFERDAARFVLEEPYSALVRGPYLSVNMVSFEEDGE